MKTAADRFWSYVIKGDGCWVWTGQKAGQGGYGRFHVSGSGAELVRQYAHRWSYEQVNGPIPDGLTIDHVCRNRLCVRPDHLEVVTLAENHERRRGIKTGPYNVGNECPHGHPRTPENTGIKKEGWRFCRPCQRAAVAAYRKKRLSV